MSALLFAMMDLLRCVERDVWAEGVRQAWDMPHLIPGLEQERDARTLGIGWWRSLWPLGGAL